MTGTRLGTVAMIAALGAIYAPRAMAFAVTDDFEIIHIPSVSSAYALVSFENTYADPIAVCTSTLPSVANAPSVVRMSGLGATGMSLALRQIESSVAVPAGPVTCMIAEAGLHALPDGRLIEARKVISTGTHGSNAVNGWSLATMNNMSAQFIGAHTSPIALAQIMSSNDAKGSAVHTNDCDARGNPPFQTGLSDGICVTKHIGEVAGSRANETIGVIVTSAGSGSFPGFEYLAARSPETILGTGNTPPYAVTTGGAYTGGVATMAGENGGNGGWAVLYGANPVSGGVIGLAIEEEIDAGDRSRTHIAEPVDYFVFRPRPVLTLLKNAEFLVDQNGDGLAGTNDVIRYTYTVTNTGLASISNVQVTDSHSGAGVFPAHPEHIHLAENAIPGDSTDTNSDATIWGVLGRKDAVIFSADYTVVEGDIQP